MIKFGTAESIDNPIMTSIIATSIDNESQSSWQQQLANLITDSQQLIDYLQLPQSYRASIDAAIEAFPLRVPMAFLQRINKGDPHDPLLKQVLPLDTELNSHPHYSLDPLQELNANPVPGIIHKYHGRVLLMPTRACAIHCRYCFRRHFPYDDNTPSRQEWQKSLNYLREDPTIEEVILSGGDPLAASDRQLEWLCQQISDIPHIKRLRIHSRLPIVLPDRIDENFLRWSSASRLQMIMVVHSNHAQEIDQHVGLALNKMQQNGFIIFNQTVLLRDINNNLNILSALSKRLIETGVIPYYLHLLDKVQGAEHFDINRDEAIELHRQLRDTLPGYMVPRLVQELAGEGSKTLIR
ncbi:L-lysine 2,3-aminomutase [Sinobacterium caligoides]|uniref:L-lysine 2,3-aminomutase n=2 Tax=Sinobacterium caligoides TaxID=933926 RepID=A0A3N2DG41_9GAMM|nr:L-lysine 2,3-aminomutase [Sinobacterium caligoides]